MKVLIIGGSNSLGISLAKYLTKLNNQVVLTYYKHKQNIKDIKCLYLDVTKEEEVINFFKNDKYDMLINMAAIYHDNSFLDNTKKDFMEVLETNLVGTFLTCREFSKNNDGMIINIASSDGIDTFNSYNMTYAASKAGIINMSKSMALSIPNKVLCICPNWVDTESTRSMDATYLDSELKRIGQSRLITTDEFNENFIKIINEYKTGDIIKIDRKGDKLWVTKVL